MNKQTEQNQRIKIVGFDTDADADMAQAINDLAVDMTDEEAEVFKAELRAEQKAEDWDSFIDKARLKVKLRAKLEAKRQQEANANKHRQESPLFDALLIGAGWLAFVVLFLIVAGSLLVGFLGL